MTKRLLLAVLCAALLVQACSLGARRDKPEKPTELQPLQNAAKVSQLWSARIGGDSEHLRLGLRPASDGTRVFAAAHDGTVNGFDLITGNRDWRVDSKLPLSAGPGYGEGLIVVGGAEGQVAAYEAVDGVRRWSASVAGEVLATPVIGRGFVIVRTVNGRLIALDATTGQVRWRYEQSMPRLSLRGIGRPAIGADRVVAGFDNGRLVALRLSDGTELWQVPLASQRGTTELERLADIDSNVIISGEEVYTAGFQSRAVLLNLMDGRAAWAEDLSSAGGIAIDWTGLYATGGDGVVVALDRRTGAQQWRQEALKYRGVTGPEAFGNAVVVGDFEGFLHWLSIEDGAITSRARAGKTRIVMPPLAVGERLFVQDESGTLYAFGTPRERS